MRRCEVASRSRLRSPVQNTPTDPKPIVGAFPITTAGKSPGAEIEMVCLDNELVITKWSPIHLRTKLKELYWKDGKSAVGAMVYRKDSLRYLYLSRLKDRDSLAQAIHAGAASRDFFGTAYGQAGDTYEDFQFRDSNVLINDTLLLIEPDAAKKYEAGLKQLEQPSIIYKAHREPHKPFTISQIVDRPAAAARRERTPSQEKARQKRVL